MSPSGVAILVTVDPSVAIPVMELHTEPTAYLGETDRESLGVAGRVGGVMYRVGESYGGVPQRRLDRGDLSRVEHPLAAPVLLQQ